MKKWGCCVLILLMLSGLLSCSATVAPEKAFSDVSDHAWYSLCAADVRDRGLMNGTGGGKFSPDGTLTRAMLVTTLWRLAGEPAPEKSSPFADVKTGEWFSDAIAWAWENAIVKGVGNNSFAPTAPVSREQMALVFYRWAEHNGLDTRLYKAWVNDSGASKWAGDAVKWARDRYLLVPLPSDEGPVEGNTIAPKDNATRAEAAVCLSRFCMEFMDSGEGISPAVVTLGENGLPEIRTPDETLTGTRVFTMSLEKEALHSDKLVWELKSEQGDEERTSKGRTLDPSAAPVYDQQGRLIQWYANSGANLCSIVYSAWGDPLFIEVFHHRTDVLSLYYKNVDGRSVLAACGVDGEKLQRFADTPPTGSTAVNVTQVDWTMTGGYVLSLRAGDKTALLSGTTTTGSLAGQEVILNAAPYIEDDLFFYPLQDVVLALGGTFSFQDGKAQVDLLDKTSVYEIGSNTWTENGEVHKGLKEYPAFSSESSETEYVSAEKAVSVWRYGTLYVPLHFGCSELSSCYAHPEQDLVILGREIANDIMVDGIDLGEGTNLKDLPPEVQALFHLTGRLSGTPHDLWYDMLTYESDTMTLYVMEEHEGMKEGSDGMLCGLKVTAPGPRTARGLQVGDSIQRLETLYGPMEKIDRLCLAYHLVVDTKDGKVSSFAIYSRFWGPDL